MTESAEKLMPAQFNRSPNPISPR